MDLLQLSHSVPHTKYTDLGIRLGFTYAHLENVLVQNMNNVEKAVLEILMEWKTAHGDGPEQVVELKRALTSAGVGALPRCLGQKTSDALEPGREGNWFFKVDNPAKI